MFETVGVLVVFFFLLAAGFAFYFNVQKSSLQKEASLSVEKFAFQTALKVFHLPELDCSFLTARRDNCIDKVKAVGFSRLLSNESVLMDYFGDFGFSTITVRQAWPLSDSVFVDGVTLYDNVPLDNKGSPDFRDKLVSISPVLLFDPWRDEYAFGVVEVAVYVK